MPYLIAPPDSGDSVSFGGEAYTIHQGRLFTDSAELLGHMLAHGFTVDESEPADGGETATDPAIDPTTADKDALLAFLKDRGEKVDGRTGEDKLRARVAELLAQAAGENGDGGE